jgi:hypothetical protein
MVVLINLISLTSFIFSGTGLTGLGGGARVPRVSRNSLVELVRGNLF